VGVLVFCKQMHTEERTDELQLPADARGRAQDSSDTGETPLPAAQGCEENTGPSDHEGSRQRRSLAEFS
jgi:hypothetical protein